MSGKNVGRVKNQQACRGYRWRLTWAGSGKWPVAARHGSIGGAFVRWPMERQLDKVSGGLLQGALEKRGLKFYLSRQTEAVLGETTVTGLRFKGWRRNPG